MDNSDLFSNKYLVDKYSKINLDKVQIIPFIPMQAILFLTLTINQSQNYLINFNCLTN